MHNTSITSIINLKKYKSKLTRDEKIVWDTLYFNGGMTDRELASVIGWECARVSARRNGLISKKACVDNGKRPCSITGNMVTEWKAVAFEDLAPQPIPEPQVITKQMDFGYVPDSVDNASSGDGIYAR